MQSKIKTKNYMNIIYIILIIVCIAFLYSRYNDNNFKKSQQQKNKDKNNKNNNNVNNQNYSESMNNDYKSFQKYLITEKDEALAKSKKPILWIPINYEYNSRNWESFGSRSSFKLNQPYLYLTVKSIISNCSDSFHICIIDDDSFTKLIPNWKINMDIISSPLTTYMRTLGNAKLLEIYGGLIVPPSFLCIRDLIEMYNTGISKNNMFVCENIDRNITATTHEFYPNINFMGAIKSSKIINQFIDFVQRIISTDNTSQSEFLGEFDRWCNLKVKKGYVTLIPGKMIGIKTMDDTQIIIDNLLQNEYINFYPNMYGIYLPQDEILSRTYYHWFARLSTKQVLESNTIIGKYILLATAATKTKKVVEQLETNKTKDWIGYWQVPSNFGLWGLKPNVSANYMVRKDTEPRP